MTYLAVALIGALVGLVELLPRGAAGHWRTLVSAPAITYLAVSALACAAVLFVIATLNISLSGGPRDVGRAILDDGRAVENLWRVVVAATVGTLLMRASVLRVPVGGQTVAVGPAIVLDMLLAWFDRAADQAIGRDRGPAAYAIMADVDFGRAMTALPAVCFQMTRSVTPEEQRAFGESVAALAHDAHMDDRARAVALGLSLMTIVGEPILRSAVATLGRSILRDDIVSPEPDSLLGETPI